MSNFIHFKDVVVNRPETWKGKRILSLDIDWASDKILNYTLDMIEEKGCKACFFVTHQTKVLERIKENPLIELGIHPNFNPLLDGVKDSKTAAQIIDDLLEIVPNAQILRSHSMTTSGKWVGLYKQKGITHLSNYLQYGVEPIVPFMQINGLVEVPVYFADDGFAYINESKEIVNITKNLLFSTNVEGIKVFNFHPVHLYIDTENISDYYSYKINEMIIKKTHSFGSRSILDMLKS
tara:strand:- start:10578 stop:11285 length:708 start_codon:yes stop_codon:yes gene_type:complete